MILMKDEKQIYPHIRTADKDDVIAILENYETEILRSDTKDRRAKSEAVMECIDRIRKMDMCEAIPVDFIETEVREILKVRKPEAKVFAKHIMAVVNSWRNKSKIYIQPDAVERFIEWACRWLLEQDGFRDKDKYLEFMQNLINAWNEKDKEEE